MDYFQFCFKLNFIDYLGSALLTKLFYENYQSFIKQVAGECEQDTSLADVPINVFNLKKNKFKINSKNICCHVLYPLFLVSQASLWIP